MKALRFRNEAEFSHLSRCLNLSESMGYVKMQGKQEMGKNYQMGPFLFKNKKNEGNREDITKKQKYYSSYS